MEDYKSKYEHALRVVEKLHRSWKETQNRAASEIEEAFPELSESEDEKIRKYIIWHLKHTRTYPDNSINNHVEEAIAWLEKQGEQKPDFCHHEVDLSNCSEEYRKAYYDGWNNCNQQHAQLEAEQKPIWNEENEQMLESCIDKMNMTAPNLWKKEIDWLKSLKDRVQPRPKQEWSEEDERNLKEVITHVREYQRIVNPANETGESDLTDWLKSIKDRVQPKQEWSEEDIEKMVKKRALSSGTTASEMTFYRQGIEDTIKSLKSQPHWKPSEVQLETLWNAICYVEDKINSNFVGGCMLESLYEDLKKL